MATTVVPPFDFSLPLSYLGLPQDYKPSPRTEPILFLQNHLSQLPPHISLHFSQITSPKQRTVIPAIRNRRLKWSNAGPSELQFLSARDTWPNLWEGRERQGLEAGDEEKQWAENGFLRGSKKHVGNIGRLLGEYEEERAAERVRVLRREKIRQDEFIPEEDESESDEEPSETGSKERLPTFDEVKATFERLIRERFIYGLLEDIDYDKVDWDESLDEDGERDVEERWFDDDDDDIDL